MATFLSVVVFCLSLSLVDSHPQCLDFQPPFKPNAKSLWCKEYSGVGCCTEQDDQRIKSLYEKALETVAAQSRRRCGRYLSKVVCLSCHAWSAHIFDAEANPYYDAKAALPCLSWKYCTGFMRYCAPAIQYLYGEAMNARNVTIDRFCWEAEVAPDKDLCFPKITRTIHKLRNNVAPNIVKGVNASKQKGCLCAREVVKNLRNPLALLHANDKTHRMFIVEQIGLIYVLLPNGTKLDTPFLDIRPQVFTSPSFGDERGLLGMAFHPKYKENGRLFLYYIARNWGKKDRRAWWLTKSIAVLSEWRVSGANSNLVNRSSERVLMVIGQPKGNHNGGQLLFGEDQYLYVFTGDGGGAGDPFGKFGNALNKSTLLGKVLRIDVDEETKPYSIPPDNPFLKEPQTLPEIYAYGVRNPWRCSVDRGDRETGYGKGRIFCGDVGQNAFEEIDIIVKGGNYGWRGREGFKCYDKRICNSSLMAGEVFPIHAYSHDVGQSIVGGYVYRGCKYPKMRGLYFFADTMNGRMFTLRENIKDKTWQSREVCMGDSSYCNGPGVSGHYATMILSFGEDESGELYILSTTYTDNEARNGAVYQLFDPERRADPTECSCTNRKPNDVCDAYKRLGFCTRRYIKYMTKYCKLSCGLC